MVRMLQEQFDVKHLTYGDNNQAGKEMGTITVSPKSGNKNFSGTKTHKFDIKGIELGGTLKVFGSNKKEIRTNKNSCRMVMGSYKRNQLYFLGFLSLLLQWCRMQICEYSIPSIYCSS